MRRIISLSRDTQKAMPPNGVVYSPLGSRIPLASLIQALSVAEHLNFRHAASALGVSQSSVSTRIKQLEQDLGVLLFERRHRGVRVTEAGQHFLEHVATGIEHLDHAVRTAGAISRGEQGRLHVGLYSSIAAGFLAELLSQFRELHPAVDLLITEGRARDTIRQVREARLDVAFVGGTPPASGCHSKPLWTEALVVALRYGHPLTGAENVRWSELAGENFVARSGGAGPQVHDHIVLRLAEHWSRPRIQRSVTRACQHSVKLTADQLFDELTRSSPSPRSRSDQTNCRKVGEQPLLQAARNQPSWYCSSWRGLQSDASTPDDSRLITPETTPP
jgi:DNA-binding transcriptional LysR family regulator